MQAVGIQISELERSDFDVIRPWIDVKMFRVFREPVTDKQLERLMSRTVDGKPAEVGLKISENGVARGFLHAVVDAQNNLGHIQQILTNPDGGRRKGLGTILMKRFLEKGFNEMGLHRIQLFVDEPNSTAVSFYKSLGFHTDGLMRDALKVEGGYEGFYCMSMLADEYPEKSRASEV